MSCDGTIDGSPLDGNSTLLEASMSVRASICASSDSGTCTAIWSPSKSALKAAQTSGCSWMALPSISTGSIIATLWSSKLACEELHSQSADTFRPRESSVQQWAEGLPILFCGADSHPSTSKLVLGHPVSVVNNGDGVSGKGDDDVARVGVVRVLD